jgi:cytochrome P450
MTLPPLEITYDPLEFYDDPYPLYRRLRDSAPVYHSEKWRLWVLSRYADVQAAARDWHTFTSARGVDLDSDGDFSHGPGDLLSMDPPRHDELRKVLHRSFSANAAKQLETMIASEVEQLLDPLIARGHGDFAREFARSLPFSVICGLWGLPRDDHQLVEGWFERMLVREPGQMSVPEDVWIAREEMRAYLVNAVRERRLRPQDDLLSTIAAAVSDGRMTEDEVVGMTRILLIAGIHTTEVLIANSLLLLAEMPAARRALAEDPQRIPIAIEELLRYEPPVQWLARATTKAVELHGCVIPAGERVVLQWGAANRDERRFDTPDRIDLSRKPNTHMAFGSGIHFCLGAHLARLEGRIALQAFFTRIPEYRIAGPIERLHTHQERGISRLPLEIVDTM